VLWSVPHIMGDNGFGRRRVGHLLVGS